MEEIRTKDFFDMILPGTVKFLSDHYIVGDSYRCVWVIREYPPSTEEQAILSQLADRNGVTLRIYHRLVEAMEQRKIIQNATRRNKMKSGGNDMNDTIEAEGNLQDVIELLANLRKNREPLLHCSVFIELKAKDMDSLKELQSEIAMELTRSKMSVDRLTLRQKEGFLSVLPVGFNQFGLAVADCNATCTAGIDRLDNYRILDFIQTLTRQFLVQFIFLLTSLGYLYNAYKILGSYSFR